MARLLRRTQGLMVAALLALSLVGAVQDWDAFSFEDFKRRYPGFEGEHRRAIFEENKRAVLKQNAEYRAGHSTWYAAINEFSAMTKAEFAAQKKGLKHMVTHRGSAPALLSSDTPDHVDWREHEPSVVTPVKNQEMCGSCWAFASTAVIESHFALATGKLAVLAPQTLVNCAPNPDDCGGTGGCEGSIPELAFNYTKASGIALESDLPYKAHDEKCLPYKAEATLEGYVKLPANSASSLESALANVGPVAVNVAANWQMYHGGIFSGGCKQGESCMLDHVVVATGYQKPTATSEGYWLIRNSWGSSWGEAGYIRLSRALDNTTFVDDQPGSGVACKPFPTTQKVDGESGVLFDMSYPTGVKHA